MLTGCFSRMRDKTGTDELHRYALTKGVLMKNRKVFWFFITGIILYLIDLLINPSVYFPSSGGRGFTLGAKLIIFLSWPPVLAILIIGIPCFLVGLIIKNYKKPLLIFTILFFTASIFRAGQTIIITYILQPKISRNLEELVEKGIFDPETEKKLQGE